MNFNALKEVGDIYSLFCEGNNFEIMYGEHDTLIVSPSKKPLTTEALKIITEEMWYQVHDNTVEDDGSGVFDMNGYDPKYPWYISI